MVESRLGLRETAARDVLFSGKKGKGEREGLKKKKVKVDPIEKRENWKFVRCKESD